MVIEQIEVICPICGKHLLLFKGGGLYKIKCRNEKCLEGTPELNVNEAKASFWRAYEQKQKMHDMKIELIDKYLPLVFAAIFAGLIAIGDIFGILVLGMNLHEEVLVLSIPIIACSMIYFATHTNRTLLAYASKKALKNAKHIEENEEIDLNDVKLCLEYIENKLVYQWYGHYEYPTFDERVQPLAENLTLAKNLNLWLSKRISINADVSKIFVHTNILVEHIALMKVQPSKLKQNELNEINEELTSIVNELKALRSCQRTGNYLLTAI